MIKSLNIKNYAIIDDLNIEFYKGFNVFTGETGAGKSIILTALSYLVKGKADSSLIASGKDKAVIEGVFSVDDYMIPLLNEADIDYDDELIIRRTISLDGRNTIKINENSVTLSFLNKLFDEHIDIHSQKDSQFLLNKKNHLYLLDKYCRNEQLIDSYLLYYQQYIAAQREYDEIIHKTIDNAELDYLKHNYDELINADLKLDEEKQLEINEKRYKSSEKILNNLNSAIEIYENTHGIYDSLDNLIKLLNLDDEFISEVRNNLNDISYSLADNMDKLKQLFNKLNDNDINIDQIEERLFLYSRLKRKYQKNTEELINYIQDLKNQIAFIEDRDVVLKDKLNTVNELKKKCEEKAELIHQNRLANAAKLEKEVQNNCLDLLLNDIRFSISINQTSLNSQGYDDIEFLISLNKGEQLKPLRNVASGGEISRVMLALKTVFAKLSECSLLIFDEIDSGVSGKVALAMGYKIAKISLATQVLVITHLAPVAACADHHFYIYKDESNNKTHTNIRLLNNEEIIKELAYVSTAETSDISINAARELYNTAQEAKSQ